MPSHGLRLMLYDRTCRGPGPLPGLSTSWWLGAHLHRFTAGFDAWHGAASWDEGLHWLATVRPSERIEEIQFWGHGQPGCVLIDRRPLDVHALDASHPLHPDLEAVRERLHGPESLWWFRTCLTFGRSEGLRFAREWTRFFNCRAAGHTWVIGPVQGGLHELGPGEEPDWPEEEGVPPPGGWRLPPWLRLDAPNRITLLRGRLPPRATR